MSAVFTALATSVDGYITGPDPSPDQPLGRGGNVLFDWYGDGDTPSREFPSFRLSTASADVFDHAAARVGAVIAGRTTYDHSGGWGGGGPHPTAALVVLSHRPAPAGAGRQTFVATGIADAIAAARDMASDRDVALMGSGMIRAALDAGLLDEVIIHQVPVLLGAGTSLFQPRATPVGLRLRSVVPAPGVTHLHYDIEHGK
jgi:dihydrofolate reductase